MIEADVLKALSVRHKGDFFITRVKSGPTHVSSGLLVMDGVAIAKSWTSPCITIYEVKVDRQDFLNDRKWHNYLPYGNQFCFVCPKQLIVKDDLKSYDGVGLMWINPETMATRYVIRPRYKPFEQGPDPWFLMYMIMNRLDNDRLPFYSRDKEYIQDWLADRKSSRDLSYTFKSRMIKRLTEQEDRIRKLEGEESDGQQILAMLEKRFEVSSKWQMMNLLRDFKEIQKFMDVVDFKRVIDLFNQVKQCNLEGGGE